MRLPLGDIGLAALGVVTLVLCAQVITQDPAVDESARVEAVAVADAVASPSATAAAQISTVVVIGDDYAESPVHGYPLQLAKRLGWQVTGDIVTGTGYVGAGEVAPGLPSRITAALGRGPDLVLLALGLNDARADAGDQEVATAARAAFASLAGQRAVIVGPFWPGTASTRAAQVDDLLAAEAAAAGLTYLSPTDERWLAGVATDTSASVRAFLDDDLVRPNAVGSKVLSDRLEGHMRELGLASAKPAGE